MFELRPYQQAAVDEVQAHRRDGRNSAALQSPTGSGKTVMAMALIQNAMEAGQRVMFLAPRRELVHQAADKLDHLGLRHGWDYGICMAGVDGAEAFIKCPVQVASKDTLRARIRRGRIHLPDAGLVIADECHMSLSPTWLELLEQYLDQGAFLVGLSATPCRGDGRGLGRLYDVLVKCPSVQALTDAGYLVPASYFAPSTVDLAGIATDYKTGDYRRGALEKRVNNATIVGDIVSHWLQHAGGRRTVVFCAGVKHSLHVAEAFGRHGVAVAHVDGNTSLPDRERIFGDFRSGAIQVLTNCDVATIGLDLPAIDCVVLARPTKSLVVHLQMLGRGLRPAEAKSDCLVLDHSGNTNRLGFAVDPVAWTLDDSTNVTDSTRNSLPVRGDPTTCPGCQFVYRDSRECPNCGWEPVRRPRNINVLDGELVELAASPIEEQQRFYRMLLGVAESRNWRPGWACYAYEERRGHRPPWAWQSLRPLAPDKATLGFAKYLDIKRAKRPNQRGAANHGRPSTVRPRSGVRVT